MNVKDFHYREYGRCIKVDNGILELIIPLDFGIRILKLGFVDGKNLFCEAPGRKVDIAGKEWFFYGGHRLWISPETQETYFPDNDPIKYEVDGNTLKLIQPVDEWSGVIKIIEITLAGNDVRLVHRVKNLKPQPRKLALWSISVMAPGGIEIIPFKGKDTGWLHNRQLSVWPYTRMADPRVRWLDEFITLQHDSGMAHPFKVGFNNVEGWGLYFNSGDVFIKKYKHAENLPYPDNNVWYETYTCDFMLEMETLSPILELAPQQWVEHVEEWSVVKANGLEVFDDSSIAPFLESLTSKLT